jgi:putative membrane protein
MSYKRIWGLISLFISIRILFLVVSGELSLYVHPRYTLFTTILTFIGVGLIFLGLMNKSARNDSTIRTYFLLIASSIILAFPTQTLSSRIAVARQQNDYRAAYTELSTYDNFTRDYSHFDIRDWVSYLATKPDASALNDKAASFTGFIYESENVRYVARFQLSCCAVDATPMTIQLHKTDLVNRLANAGWYELKGSFMQINDDTYELNVYEAIEILEPEEPYVY